MHEFRKNWWSHTCSNGKIVWKHKVYKHCDICGYYNGVTKMTQRPM